MCEYVGMWMSVDAYVWVLLLVYVCGCAFACVCRWLNWLVSIALASVEYFLHDHVCVCLASWESVFP